jgi:hypothetical protein
MKQVSSKTFLPELEVNAAQIHTKEGKHQICFSMSSGKAAFGDKHDDIDECINIATHLGLKKVQDDLFLRIDQLHTAEIFEKKAVKGAKPVFKVCLNFKQGEPVYSSGFDSHELAQIFIQDKL